MPKLTQEQIAAVDKALWDIEIRFLDIRIEMTDHAATTIEGMEGNFERNLRKYIFENKKELRKNYRKFRTNASLKAMKLLLRNILSFRFLLILVLVYVALWADYNYEGLEETSMNFMVYSAMGIVIGAICIVYIKFVNSYKLFSTAERLMAIMGSLAFSLCIPVRIWVDRMEINDGLKLLYYALVAGFLIMTMITYRSLTKIYKSRYQVI